MNRFHDILSPFAFNRKVQPSQGLAKKMKVEFHKSTAHTPSYSGGGEKNIKCNTSISMENF